MIRFSISEHFDVTKFVFKFVFPARIALYPRLTPDQRPDYAHRQHTRIEQTLLLAAHLPGTELIGLHRRNDISFDAAPHRLRARKAVSCSRPRDTLSEAATQSVQRIHPFGAPPPEKFPPTDKMSDSSGS